MDSRLYQIAKYYKIGRPLSRHGGLVLCRPSTAGRPGIAVAGRNCVLYASDIPVAEDDLAAARIGPPETPLAVFWGAGYAISG
ncbi:MAG: hypothetical protein N3E40_01340 [Dehalococcoidia bacterium]|nr:hypothetical protein [Dehalococcoidia bacterium]